MLILNFQARFGQSKAGDSPYPEQTEKMLQGRVVFPLLKETLQCCKFARLPANSSGMAIATKVRTEGKRQILNLEAFDA